MRFLLDQDVYAVTARVLLALGHDVVTAFSAGFSREEDDALLNHAHNDDRIFVTRDRDFGGLVFVMGHGPGVLNGS